MTTETIDCIEDVQVGDVVTLERGSATVKAPVGKNDTFSGTNLFVLYLEGFGTLYGKDGWVFVSATREVPEWEPGTVYEITTPDGDTVRAWCLKHVPGGSAFVTRDGDEFTAEELASIQPVPDDAETLRRSLDVAHEGYRKAAADWRTRDRRMGAEVERLDAEVERLRASMNARTDYLVASGGTLWHHGDLCGGAPRALPTRAQIARVLHRTVTASAIMANAGADAVLGLLEEGGAS